MAPSVLARVSTEWYWYLLVNVSNAWMFWFEWNMGSQGTIEILFNATVLVYLLIPWDPGKCWAFHDQIFQFYLGLKLYYIAAPAAWAGYQRCCIGVVQILFEPEQTICCYQWYMVITSKSVFWSTSGISTWPNIIHHVQNTTGCNSMEISTKFPFLRWWHTAVHGLQTKQLSIITPNHQ